ncbi:MAG: PAS domain S-box-containing protein [Candidatus Nitrotoga sp. SPKER]|nr:MAG: PAS domain S-box-containing protein [Candidatus Nitrotoga sp. SPKER]
MISKNAVSSSQLILVVDDEDAKRYTITHILKRGGHNVIEATTGQEALDLAKNHKPALIVLDINLPDINGFEVCQKLRQMPELSSVIIVQFSANYIAAKDKIFGLEKGADAYLTQPLESAELLATINAMLRMREAEEKVHKLTKDNEERLLELANSMPQMVWSAPPNGQPDFYNHRVRDLIGNDYKLMTERWQILVHPEDAQHVTKARAEGFQSENPFEIEYRLKQPDGSYNWMLSRVVPVFDESKILRRWYGTVTDISQVREREIFLKSVLDSSPDCIKVLDLQGRMISMNRAGLEIMGMEDFTACELQPWTSFWKGEEHQKAIDALAKIKRGETSSFEGYGEAIKGIPKWWEVSLTLIKGAEGFPVQILVLSRDITLRHNAAIELEKSAKEAEAAKIIAENANNAKSDFLANMSHEIRTPMNVVIGLTNILSKSDNLTSKQIEFINTLKTSADSLMSLINDLLDISKIESGNLNTEKISFSFYNLLLDVVIIMQAKANEKNISLLTELDEIKELNFIGDSTKISQIVTNLCGNALKFTERGHVKISALKQERFGKNYIDIIVSDTGIGIPADKQDFIFQKFMQADASINRKFGGTGLGLAISKTLAEAMGGQITVFSEIDKGSTFTLSLPLAVSGNLGQKESHSEEASLLMPHVDKPKLLLVEDHAPNVLVASTLLEELGYQIDTASNGNEAIIKARDNSYLAIIMDVQMPGINGLEATKTIRQEEITARKTPVPIIGMTAHALVGDREKCLAAGMDNYISKPFRLNDLAEALKNVANK